MRLSRVRRAELRRRRRESGSLRACAPLNDVQDVLGELSGLREKPAGRLRLLVPRVAGTAVLGPKLAKFGLRGAHTRADFVKPDIGIALEAGVVGDVFGAHPEGSQARRLA